MSLDGIQVHLIDNVTTAYECKRWLSTCNRVALDTEAGGLDKDKHRARLVQLGDARQAYVIPIEWDGWGALAIELVTQFDGEFILHNMTYDDAMLYNALKIRLPRDRTHDTRFQAHVLSSTGSLALKKLSTLHVDPRAAMLQDDLTDVFSRGGWTWETIPWNMEQYWFYAGVDTILTYQLDEYQRPLVQREAPASYELELAVAWVCERMERRGVRVDREYTQRFANELSAYVEEAEAWCRAHYGVYPGSNNAVVERLQRDGVEFTRYTGGGAICLDKDVLGELDHPLAQTVLGRRRAQKMVSTYLGNYLDRSARDGRIHASINTVGGVGKNPFEPGGGKGVRTGRMSSSDVNLQNVPVRGVASKRIRRCFTADENETWIKCDADQIEMRMLAHMSGDERMREAFLSEGDFFVNQARELFHEPNFQKSDPRRQIVKNSNYAKVFGAGIPKFAETAGIPEDEARTFMQRFDTMFPDVQRWIRQVGRDALDRLNDEGESYIRSPVTNRKHVADARKEYALVNYVIQGTAGEVLKMKIVEADQAGLGDFMLFPVHDEIDLSVPNDQLDDALTTLLDVCNDDKLLTVPLTWSADVGPNWGDCS